MFTALRAVVISKPRGILFHEQASPGLTKYRESNAMPHAKQSNQFGKTVVADLRRLYRCWGAWDNFSGFALRSIFLW